MTASTTTFTQNIKKDAESLKTKMEVFSSKTGAITKFVDIKLPVLPTTYGSVDSRIRKISNGATTAYFYQISKDGKHSTSTASIEYSDLLEVLKAIKALKLDLINDITTNPDYLENKFVSVDGFQIGYYISGNKSAWYIKLEEYGSDNTLFIEDVDTIENAFTEAKNKITELKK